MDTEKLFNEIAHKLFYEGELSGSFIEKGLPETIIQFKHYISELYLDFDLLRPKTINKRTQRIFIGSALVIFDFKIKESDLANRYDLYLKVSPTDWSALRHLSPIEPYLKKNIAFIIRNSNKLFEDGVLDFIQEKYTITIVKWNLNKFVTQERIFKMSRKLMSQLESETGNFEESIIVHLHNYYKRVNKAKLINLKRFERKISHIMPILENDQVSWNKFLIFLLKEISNGGTNIHSAKDIYNNYILLEALNKNP